MPPPNAVASLFATQSVAPFDTHSVTVRVGPFGPFVYVSWRPVSLKVHARVSDWRKFTSPSSFSFLSVFSSRGYAYILLGGYIDRAVDRVDKIEVLIERLYHPSIDRPQLDAV